VTRTHGQDAHATGEPIEPHDSNPPLATLAQRGADEIVDLDLSCRSCGYNLRGLTFGANCPECNTAVALSAKSDLLRFGDPNWTRRLSQGAGILAAGFVLTIAWMFVQFVAPRFLPSSSLYILFRFGGLLPEALLFSGWWLVTKPDPSGAGEQQYGFSRRFTRIAASVLLVEIVFEAFAWGISLARTANIAYSVIRSAVSLFLAGAHIAEFNYLSLLAKRIPSDSLIANGRQLRIAAPIVRGVASIVSWAFYFHFITRGPMPTSKFITVYSSVSVVIQLIGFVLDVLIAIYLAKYFKAINRQRLAGKQITDGLNARSADLPQT
jgi:hypothetical protein